MNDELERAAFEWFAGDETGDLKVAFLAGASWQKSRDEERVGEFEARCKQLTTNISRLLVEEMPPEYHDCVDNGGGLCAWCDAEEALKGGTNE